MRTPHFLRTAYALALFLGVGCAAPPAPVSSPLPAPTGSLSIGTTVLHLVDSTRVDPILAAAGRYRALTVQVWYPATDAASDARAPYIPDSALVEAMLEAEYWDQSDSTLTSWRTMDTHATLGAPFDTDGSRWPLLVFSHGLGVSRAQYTTLIQDLASHGYVVAAVEHPYGGFAAAPDGRILTTAQDPVDFDDPAIVANRIGLWSADVSSVLDQMLDSNGAFGRFAVGIDTSQIGMLGHSIGGAAALEACRTEGRIKACVDFDGAPFGQVETEGLRRPTLVMGSGPDYSDEDLEALGRTREQWDRMGEQIRSIWESIASIRPSTPAYLVTILGTGHMSYSDAPFVMPTTITRFGGRVIEPERGFVITTATVRAFLDAHMREQGEVPFETLSEQYPEVSFLQLN